MSGRFGVDVASRRADDLDKKCLAEIATLKNPAVLDLGCGAGGQSVRMAEIGAKVIAVDIEDHSEKFEAHESIEFMQCDIADITSILQGKQFDFCVLQRVIHYLPYAVALDLLTHLREHVTEKMFISATGISSDIGDQYPMRDEDITSRFATLTSVGQKTFSISEPLCIYSPTEFMALLVAAGFEVEECWVSAFQNIKAVCR